MDKLEQLFSKIESYNNDKIIYNDSFLGMDLELVKLPLRKFAQLQEGADKGAVKALDVMASVIYSHVPLFQEKELIEKLEIKLNIHAVVPAIYNQNMGAMTKLYNFINTKLYGLDEENFEGK